MNLVWIFKTLGSGLLIVLSTALAKAQFSESEFNSRVAKFTEFAQPLIEPRQLLIEFDPEWVGNIGSCYLTEKAFVISIGSRMNETVGLSGDQLDLILCHELGHLLGQGPRKSNNLTEVGNWAAGEGESDYFSGSCLKALWSLTENQSRIEPTAEKFFRLLFTFFGRHTGEQEPSLSRKDSTTVSENMLGYPSLQCRLDSVVAGAQSAPRPQCWHHN